MKKTFKSLLFLGLCMSFLAGCTTEVEDPTPVESVALNTNTLSLEVGSEETLVATVNPDNAYMKTISWKTGNSNYVSVDSNGKVKAIKKTTTGVTITAYVDENKNGTLDTNEKKATCKVSVVDKLVKVTSISLNPTSKTISKSETFTITATVAPSNATTKTVSWTVASGSSVSVSTAGKVTPKAFGTSVVRATATDGSGIYAECTVTVEEVKVSSVTLPATKTIKEGSTTKLSATVLPSNADNKEVTWSVTSGSSVAVSTDGTVSTKSLGTSVVRATAKDGSGKYGECEITVVDKSTVLGDAYTILMYVCGSNLESGYDSQTRRYDDWANCGLASRNIQEILSLGANQPDGVNIVIETGGARRWLPSSEGGYDISSSNLERYHIEGTKLVRDAQLTKANMGLSSTLQSFVEYGINTYPAEKMAFVFWNHGGAMYGCCNDELYNDDSLTNQEVNTAFKNAFKNTGRTEKFEWVAYDCCLMAVQDIAEFNSEYFNYMGASQESEPGAGWDYDNFLDDLYADPYIDTPTLLSEMADTFVEKCRVDYADYAQYCLEYYEQHHDSSALEEYNTYKDGYNDATFSVFDLSKIGQYKTDFESLASSLTNTQASKLEDYKSSTTEFGYGEFDVYDVKQLLSSAKSQTSFSSVSNKIDTVLNDLNEVVIHNSYGKNYDKKPVYGLNCVIMSQYSGYYDKNNTHFTNWMSKMGS